MPIIAVRGSKDTLVSRAETLQWRDATTGGFTELEIPGGHMYLVDGPGPLLDAVTPVIAREHHD